MYMTTKRSQIKIRLIALLLGCITVAGLICFCILWVYSSSNAFQMTSGFYIDAYQQMKWLYGQKESLSEEYFQASEQELLKQIEQNEADVYIFEAYLRKNYDLFAAALYATEDFSIQYNTLSEQELRQAVAMAKRDKQKPALVTFKNRKMHPVMLYGNLEGDTYIGIISHKSYLSMDKGYTLLWSVASFIVFATVATGIIFSFGKRLDEAMIRLDVANQNLAKELEQKEQMYNAMRGMLANLSHDLKTPVTLIQLHTEALRDNIYLDIEKDMLYDTITAETQHLTNLINRIVTLAKLESAIQAVRPTLFSLHDVVLTCYQRFLLPIREKNIEFILPEDQEMLIEADYAMTEQVVINLLENALTYTEQGGRIKLFYEETPETIRMNLFNTHKPIPEKELQKLFQNFYRKEKSRSQKGHYGLGLAIVKSAVSLMEGKCGAYNMEEGIVFYIEFKKISQRFQKDSLV